jgi:manganese transport protein
LLVSFNNDAVSAAVFYPDHEVTEIEQAHDMLEILLNSSIAPAAFGLGLLCAGQSSTLTGTLAGQIVMEGFVEVQMRPWLRRLLTRCVAIVPAVIVIAVMGNAGTYKLLILSQVILSLQLPFAIIPLIKFSSSSSVMGIYITKLWVRAFTSLRYV